jgi:xanthine dehydrogenase YagR molybdenum-binding subunit
LREAVAQKLGFNSEGIMFENGQVRSGNRSVPLSEAARPEELAGEDKIEWGKLSETHQQSTFGAHFIEVDVATGETRSAACWQSVPQDASLIRSRPTAK